MVLSETIRLNRDDIDTSDGYRNCTYCEKLEFLVNRVNEKKLILSTNQIFHDYIYALLVGQNDLLVLFKPLLTVRHVQNIAFAD